MKRLCLVTLLVGGYSYTLPTVPNEMVFCGMRTTIHPDAKKAIEAYIIKLHDTLLRFKP